MNRYRNANYSTGAYSLKQLPPDRGREIAFAGRSNAGKSSVINALTGQRRLAKTSKTPGRTQLINFFSLDEDRRLVDLPGYGYANVAGKLRSHWSDVLGQYLRQRRSLVGLVLIIDIRRRLGDADRKMLGFSEAAGLSLHLLLNKADKLAFAARQRARAEVERAIEGRGHSVQLFSVPGKSGVEELIQRLDAWFFE